MTDIKSSRLVEAIKAIEDGIYIIDHNYTVEYMNSAMIKIFGDGVGKKCYEVINNGNGICSWCRFQEVFDKGETHHYGEVYLEHVNKTFSLIELPITNRDGTRSKLSIYRDITKEKEQQARLKSSEEGYKRLFDHVGCGVFISSKKGKFLDVNPAFLKMLGYTKKDNFLSMDIATDLYLTPEDRKKFMETVEKHGRVVDYEVEWRRRDGHLIQVLVTSHVRYDQKGNVLGYEGIVVDQSQRKMMEDKMKKALNFLDQTIECSPNAIMAADLKGEVLIWNKGAEEIFGESANDVIGKKNIKEIYRGNDLARKVMKMIRSEDYGGVGKLKSYPITFNNVNNGKETEGNLSAALLYDDQGKEIASVGIFVDLGERLAMERKLSETRQQLLQSEKLAAMGRLTSQIAHELNNPLFGIMNTLELMKTEISPQNKRRKLLDMSISETMRLADMLKKMLSFSKPDQEKKINININTVLDEIILLYEKRFRENSVKFEYQFAENIPMVNASKDQLRQVFLNMISNAMDSMPDGGSLKIATEYDSHKVRIILSDTGAGIKEEHIERIFDSFFTTKTDSVKGVGLGLSVCYGFVKDHGGDIKVESRVGEGTTFIICLPISSVEK
ncbi:MAG: PAS domain S-box protein [Desulfamplus sp.]|nr:PAS domain S-box protein [Desulfamplus sp.]